MKKLHVLNGRSAVAARRALPGIFVLAVACLVLAGCRKEEAKPDPSSPKSYMNDTAFREKLKARRQTAVEIGERRSAVNAKIEALKKKLSAAELKDSQEFQALEAEGKALDEEFEKNHRETLKIVRERIVPKKPISK